MYIIIVILSFLLKRAQHSIYSFIQNLHIGKNYIQNASNHLLKISCDFIYLKKVKTPKERRFQDYFSCVYFDILVKSSHSNLYSELSHVFVGYVLTDELCSASVEAIIKKQLVN